MNQAVLGFLAETFIHPGSGQNEGVIDLPVAREAATRYPFLAGSSLKGSLLDCARTAWQDPDADNKRKRIFGEQNNAGELLTGDLRLVLLPVRTLSGAYRWVTCPHLLERLQRDCKRVGISCGPATIPRPEKRQYLGEANQQNAIHLEEREFRHQGEVSKDWTDLLASLLSHDATRARLAAQVVILHDEDFSWFARYGLPVQARNVLDETTKESKNLWYEETLPPDTVMYAVLAQRHQQHRAVGEILEMFESRPYLQTGGNETVGQGWFSVCPIKASGQNGTGGDS